MIKTRSFWKFLLALLIIGYFIFGGEHNVYQLMSLNYRARKLSDEIRRQEETTNRLRAEIRRLKTDRGYLEKIAREQFGMIKSGEKVFVVRPKER